MQATWHFSTKLATARFPFLAPWVAAVAGGNGGRFRPSFAEGVQHFLIHAGGAKVWGGRGDGVDGAKV